MTAGGMRMRNGGRVCVAGAVALLGASLPATASAVTIDFESLPPITEVTTQFAALGAIFHQANIFFALSTAHSGTQSLVAGPNFEDPDPLPLVIDFTSGQGAVSLFAGEAPGELGTLSAFDASGALVAVDGPRLVGLDYTTMFAVVDPGATIRRVEFALAGGGLEFIDDLTFEGAPPPPPPVAPIVTITSPAAGATVDTTMAPLHVTGTVTGIGIVPPARLILTATGFPPFTSAVTLGPTGDPMVFTFDALAGSSLPVGPLHITVEATNSGGITGSASVDVVNTTPAVGAQCGPGSPLGDIVTSTFRPGCLLVVCTAGGVGVTSAAVHTMPAAIARKAFDVRDRRLGADDTLGCPIDDAAPTIGGALLQAFERGSVYQLAPPGGVFYTPAVLQSAIVATGGQAATGLPVSDPAPLDSSFSPVWWFQRFHRPDANGSLDPTLEIRGASPNLFVERPGGDRMEMEIAGLTLDARTSTIWESFPCAFGTPGPAFPLTCTVNRPPPPAPLADAERFCGPTRVTPQWRAVIGDQVDTENRGWIRAHSPDLPTATGSHMAHSDNPLVHEHFRTGPNFASDWNFHIIPLREHWDLLGENFATKNFEVEIEDYFIAYFLGVVHKPDAGELLMAAGRWIVDCAHPEQLNTEVHPPSILASTITDTLFTHDVTRAFIWVNGFFSGDEFSFDLFPPPRPSPQAHLFVVKPVGVEGEGITRESASGSYGVDTVDFDFLIDHIRPRFAAPHRTNRVTPLGEKKFIEGRNYQAIWNVGWAE
jgi:hypothetical protein